MKNDERAMKPVSERSANKVAGGLLGLLIGDAVGVPYEFRRADELPAVDDIDMIPPVAFHRAHTGVPLGTWSDDGAQALCLLASLLDTDGLDLDDFGKRLLAWHDRGYLAVDGHVFDVGNQTSRALDALRSGVSPDLAGPSNERDNGNGSLMRVLPLALWHDQSDQDLIKLAALQSLPTHGHARAKVACAQLCLWARAELAGHSEGWEEAAEILSRLGPEAGLPPEEIEHVQSDSHRAKANGTGYVVDCLWSARIAVEKGHDFESTVKRAIAFGNDTDTTACVAGGIAGIRYGREGIPVRWIEGLRGKDLLDPLMQKLVVRRECARKKGEDVTSETEH